MIIRACCFVTITVIVMVRAPLIQNVLQIFTVVK